MNNNAFKKFDLTGKTALVTGGATGIGYGMTKALVEAGAKVMMAARRECVLKSAADKLMSEFSVDNVLYRSVDLADRDSVTALADHASSVMNGVDIFVGNAGMEGLQRIEDVTNPDMDKTIRVNLTANIELTRAFLPHMRKQKWGRIIFSSSAASQFGADDVMSIYSASKNGLNAFTRSVAAEAGYDGITANALIVGFFASTDMANAHLQLDTKTEQEKQALFDAFCTMIPLRKPGKAEDFAGIIQLLASDAGGYITGALIPVDGGWTAMLGPSGRPPPG